MAARSPAKLTLALMQGGAPNAEVLAATTLPELLDIAARHSIPLPAEFQEAPTPVAPLNIAPAAAALPSGHDAPPMTTRGAYDGPRNAAGEREGHGSMRFEDGSSYEGEWLANMQHGRGTMRYASGAAYVGGWHSSQKHGTGTYYWADGRTEVGFYSHDQSVGEGAMWSADQRSAWRIVDDGLEVAEVSIADVKHMHPSGALIATRGKAPWPETRSRPSLQHAHLH